MRNFHIISHQDCIELTHNENGRLTGASYLPIDKNENIIEPFLQHHIVIFVLKGKIEITCKHYKEKTVREGHMTFLSRGGFVQIKACQARSNLLVFGFDEITIRTNDTLMDFFTTHSNLQGKIHNTLPLKASMKHIVDGIVSEVRKGKLKDSSICQAWNTVLFITFVTYYTKAQITEFFRPLVNSQINFRDFIENNYLEVDSNVEKLILFSGMSHHHFYKTFVEEFGMSPKTWMLERFKQDIVHYSSRPNATTTFVATKLGITVTRLCQLTRKYYDCTPQQLIEKHKTS